jgi:hypothetical protein
MEKPVKFDRSGVKDIFAEIDQPINVDSALNARFRFYVKANGKFAYRDVSNPKRYSLMEKPNFFYLQGQAEEAVRLFKVLGHKVELIKEDAPNN